MIDIHSHLLYGVDDGAKTIEESVDILKNLSLIGYDKIILTPHYIKDTNYNNKKSDNLKRLEQLKKELEKNNININLYLGNEIYIDRNIVELLNKKEISSLDDSKYLLIELPMNGEYPNYKDIFANLITSNYHVILAHPERYLSFQKDDHKIEELIDIGVSFQCNLESILGKYGHLAKKIFKKLLKEHKITYLATDIHHKKHDYNEYLKAKKLILKYITEEEYKKLILDNPNKVIK